MVSFPLIWSDTLSCFMPGSNWISMKSSASFSRVIFSILQLKGGSILRPRVVLRGPVFLMVSVLAMGSTWTFFSQRYLNSSLGRLNCREGVMKLPKMLELMTGLGFLSLPMTTWHYQGSEILPIWNELALNS